MNRSAAVSDGVSPRSGSHGFPTWFGPAGTGLRLAHWCRVCGTMRRSGANHPPHLGPLASATRLRPSALGVNELPGSENRTLAQAAPNTKSTNREHAAPIPPTRQRVPRRLLIPYERGDKGEVLGSPPCCRDPSTWSGSHPRPGSDRTSRPISPFTLFPLPDRSGRGTRATPAGTPLLLTAMCLFGE